MKIKATTRDAYQLLHQGALALARVEHNGIRIDERRLQEQIDIISKRIARIQETLKNTDEWRAWERVCKLKLKTKPNIRSREQLGAVLAELYPNRVFERTATGRIKTDENALRAIKTPFIKRYLKMTKLEKVKNTYLIGIQREIDNGYLHPSFNLHLVRSYRSSCDNPNFQNIPIRTEWMSKIIRPCFIARPNHHIVELDYSALEVRISACYHKDPTMIKYIEDETTDMHRDMALEIFKLSSNQITPAIRSTVKGMFVFAQFYGDWWLSCARRLWEAIDELNLTTKDGTPLKEHLNSKGIVRLGELDPDIEPEHGTFARHIKRIERDFWERRFAVYNRWRKDWWEAYQRTARFKLLTGFMIEGLYQRNDVLNYAIQGAAFHCLLWTLIELEKWLTRYHKKSLIIGQIHDSIIADVHTEELTEFIETAKQIATEKIRQHWKWIIVPLKLKAEISEINGNWYDKREIA